MKTRQADVKPRRVIQVMPEQGAHHVQRRLGGADGQRQVPGTQHDEHKRNAQRFWIDSGAQA